jgi:hypothetical protein
MANPGADVVALPVVLAEAATHGKRSGWIGQDLTHLVGKAVLRPMLPPLVVQGLKTAASPLMTGNLGGWEVAQCRRPGVTGPHQRPAFWKALPHLTGASFSIFPHKSSAPPTGQKLTGPDGQLIPC